MTRTDVASRVISAPVERVYAALVDPDALTAWLPPDGMSGRLERFDARPGGSYRLILTYADASAAPGKATADSDVVEARFVDIVPGLRVVQAVDFVSDDPAYAGTMTMTWEVSTVDAANSAALRRHLPAAGAVSTERESDSGRASGRSYAQPRYSPTRSTSAAGSASRRGNPPRTSGPGAASRGR